jgi:hypothetical protein
VATGTVCSIRLRRRAISGKSPHLPCAARAMGSGDGQRPERFPVGRKPFALTSRLGPLYHNVTALYQIDAVMRDILYGLNGRRTNHARISDTAQIFVCSPQYIGVASILTLPIVKNAALAKTRNLAARDTDRLGRPFLSTVQKQFCAGANKGRTALDPISRNSAARCGRGRR